MAEPIFIARAEGRYRVRAGDLVIGETDQALVLDEKNHDPVIYVPRGDIDMRHLERSPHHSVCPWKGEASYFSVVTPAGRLENAAWTYEAPIQARAAIRGYLAFYPAVTVEKF